MSPCSCLPCCSATGTRFWDCADPARGVWGSSRSWASPKPWQPLGLPWLLQTCSCQWEISSEAKLQHFSHHSFALLWGKGIGNTAYDLRSCIQISVCLFLFYSVKFCVLYLFFSPWKTQRLGRTTFRNPLNIPKLRICLWCVRIILVWTEGCLTPINHLQIKSYTELVIMNMNFSWYTETERIWALVCMNSSWSWSH